MLSNISDFIESNFGKLNTQTQNVILAEMAVAGNLKDLEGVTDYINPFCEVGVFGDLTWHQYLLLEGGEDGFNLWKKIRERADLVESKDWNDAATLLSCVNNTNALKELRDEDWDLPICMVGRILNVVKKFVNIDSPSIQCMISEHKGYFSPLSGAAINKSSEILDLYIERLSKLESDPNFNSRRQVIREEGIDLNFKTLSIKNGLVLWFKEGLSINFESVKKLLQVNEIFDDCQYIQAGPSWPYISDNDELVMCAIKGIPKEEISFFLEGCGEKHLNHLNKFKRGSERAQFMSGDIREMYFSGLEDRADIYVDWLKENHKPIELKMDIETFCYAITENNCIALEYLLRKNPHWLEKALPSKTIGMKKELDSLTSIGLAIWSEHNEIVDVINKHDPDVNRLKELITTPAVRNHFQNIVNGKFVMNAESFLLKKQLESKLQETPTKSL